MKIAEIERYLVDYSSISSGNKIRFEKLRAVLSPMRKAGIDCILLKGADLIPRLYGVLGVRPLGDADLLVHEADLPALDQVLTRLGYRPQIDGNPAYVDPEHILALDIITSVWYVEDQTLLWQRSVPRDLQDVQVKGLGASDLLIYLTAYNVIHRGYLSASFARDIAFLVEKEAIDWDFVVEEVCRCRLKIPMYHGLSFVVTRYPRVPISDSVLRRFAPSTVIERFWHLVFEKLVTDKQVGGLGHLLLFLTRPGSKKWRWLQDAFFPSAAFLKCRYGNRWEAHALWTRLSRPFYLLSQAGRLFLRIVRLALGGRA